MLIENIYNGRDNRIDLLLKAKIYPATTISAIPLTDVTRVTLKIGNILLDSDVTASYFDWVSSGADGILKLKLGAANLSLGKEQQAILYIFDPTNPNGIHWGEFKVNIYQNQLM